MRVLAFRLAYGVQGKSVVPPLPEFMTAFRGYDELGSPRETVAKVLSTIPDANARASLADFVSSAGKALKFQSDLMSIEGAKGFSKSGTPEPDRAFSSFRSKFDALRAAMKTDPKAKMTIRDDVLSSAKESSLWDPSWDFVLTKFSTGDSRRIEVYAKVEVPASPSERIKHLLLEKDAIVDRGKKGVMTDDDLDRLPELSLENERLSGRKVK